MKNPILFFLALAVAGCSDLPADKKDTDANFSTQGSDIPPTAVRERFADNSDIEKITINDTQGNLSAQGFLMHDKKEGAWAEFNSNGMAKSVTPYINGKKEGVYLEFNSTGQFTKRIEYHNDVRHGAYVEYVYPNKKEERTYQNGKLEGTVKLYYSDGKIMEESAYKNDTRDGVSKWYDNAGNVTINYEYKNGELVKK